MKVLVTGATGFIGQQIVSKLADENYEIIGLKNSNKSSSEENLLGSKNSNISFIRADITDYRNLSGLEKIEELEVIVHSAGLAHQFGDTKKEAFDSVNVRGTENILKLAIKLKVKHFILIGSTAVYGIVSNSQNSKSRATVISEETPTKPQTLYAKSKLEAENVSRRICEENAIALTIFRLAPVIGENNVGNVSRLIEAIDKNRFVWVGNGSNQKTLIYKRDVAQACAVLIKNKKQKTEIFNLAADPIKMKDFVDEIALRLNTRILPINIPALFLKKIFQINSKIFKINKVSKISETVEKWLSDDIYSADKIARTYNFKPQTSITEAVRKQVDYYKSTKRS